MSSDSPNQKLSYSAYVLRHLISVTNSYVLRGLLDAAYNDAVSKFTTKITRDKEKIDFVKAKSCLRDVQDAVTQSLESYEAGQKYSTAKKWLQKVSLRIHIYGNVLDVMAQHHPEYVSLAWGAIKFLLTVCSPRS